jgi:hypothetical protein
MKFLPCLPSAPATILAGALLLAGPLAGLGADGSPGIGNTSVGRTYSDSLTLARSRMGMTNINGVAYIAVTRSDLYTQPGQMRLSSDCRNVGSLLIRPGEAPVSAVHVYVDTGNLPLRIQQAGGEAISLKVGVLEATNRPAGLGSLDLSAPTRQRTVLIGTVVAPGRFTPTQFESHVITPEVEVIRK